MKKQDNILLDNYFNGLLTDAQAQQVRERAAGDPAFGREFSLRTEMEDFPRRASKRQALVDTLVAVEQDFFKENTAAKPQTSKPMTAKVNWARWATAIAASLVLLLGAFWFFNQTALPEYHQYAQHAPLSLTVRGVADQAVGNAEKAFSTKDYAAALAALEQIIASDPGNITAQLYRGISLLELDRVAEARAAFAPIALGQSALRGEANWYFALSYLKEKKYAACETALQAIDPGADHYEEAQELMKKLK